MYCEALDQKIGRWEMAQDVVSLEPSECCGSSVSQTEKQLVAGEPTEEMCYLKKLHNRYCLPVVALGQELS